ncbi:MAG: hypothetical protein RL748_916, partial [Pseudomonadota bacterium]
EADRIGYPVLLKASAGGGGKGMRVVEQSADFAAALASCKREAINSFGDDKVLVEKYLVRPRHIEIQVFADSHGQCVYLFERDCSVQRRHQKVLEEAPAPGMTPERRAAMGQAAVAAATAVGYVGAGTVEFIANQDGSFYFMEMNTRLQVEHPVTEMITGQDLVEWQLRVAAGEALPLRQDQLQIHGHALEARVYAENPEKGFLPSIGTLQHLRTPKAVEFENGTGTDSGNPAAVRIDSGVRGGDAISPFYDPMIAKLIVWGKDRDSALAHMSQALAQYQAVGLSSNLAFLSRLVASQPFAAADLDTGLIERHRAELFPPLQAAPMAAIALASMALVDDERQQAEAGDPQAGDPWSHAMGWRLNQALRRKLGFSDDYSASVAGGFDYETCLTYQRHGYQLDVYDASASVQLKSRQGHDFSLVLGSNAVRGTVVRAGDVFNVFYAGQHWQLNFNDPMAHAGEVEGEGGRLTAPMPGKVVAVLVKDGQSVQKGDALVIMEAMKMEHTIAAPQDGVVEQVLYAVGDQVADGAPLLVFTAA